MGGPKGGSIGAPRTTMKTIVKTMVELSHGLGKRVLAEGVETQQQLQLLRNIGCDAVQGYFISKPISEEEFTKYLKRK